MSLIKGNEYMQLVETEPVLTGSSLKGGSVPFSISTPQYTNIVSDRWVFSIFFKEDSHIPSGEMCAGLNHVIQSR